MHYPGFMNDQRRMMKRIDPSRSRRRASDSISFDPDPVSADPEERTIDSVEDLTVNLAHVGEVVEGITGELDRKIDACNTDPAYEHPISKAHDPIVRAEEWPEFLHGAYYWGIRYLLGNDGPTNDDYSSAGMHYYPNPQQAIEVIPHMESVKALLLQENPDIDLTKDVFVTREVADKGFVVSNDYYEVLTEYFKNFDAIRESRLEQEEL